MNHLTSPSSVVRTGLAGAATVVAAGALVVGLGASSNALFEPGTDKKDVTFGRDNDNATNTFIQPPGVTAKQHMDNTDVLFGRANDDLLVGNLGSDTLLGGKNDDILVGGPERFTAPNSDVLVGDYGDDINIWAPGDGSDAFAGNEGKDTMIFAPFVTDASGALLITKEHGRKIPHVDIDAQPAFSCTIVPVPASQKLGAQFLIRFNVNGAPVVTVRQKDVEKVYCPSPTAGTVLKADLTGHHPVHTRKASTPYVPEFRTVRLDRVYGTVGDILAPVR